MASNRAMISSSLVIMQIEKTMFKITRDNAIDMLFTHGRDVMLMVGMHCW